MPRFNRGRPPVRSDAKELDKAASTAAPVVVDATVALGSGATPTQAIASAVLPVLERKLIEEAK
jgi:ribosomal protein S12 methylthiotransferase accessory factor YcaO